METKELKRTVKFKDAKGKVFTISCEITHRNGYPEFTMCGEHGGGCGQCDKHINPKNEHQKELLKIWNKWHLNGMNAGTNQQEIILKNYEKQTRKKLNYDLQCEVLKAHKITGEALTVIEADSINRETAEVKKKVDVINEKIKGFKIAVDELKEHQKNPKMGGAWVKVPKVVLTLSRTKERDIKQGHKFYDSCWQIKKDAEAIETLIKKENGALKLLQDETLNPLLLSTAHYDKHPTTGEPYQYGTEWIKLDLPLNFWGQVCGVLDKVEETEAKRRLY